MNITSLTTDNISEMLIRIIEFTQIRQKVLANNIANAHLPDFIPQELEVDEFSDSLSNAIEVHIRTQKLVLHDSENIKFGPNGAFSAIPVNDTQSKELLEENLDVYIEVQKSKLWENSLNQKVAAELLKQKQEAV